MFAIHKSILGKAGKRLCLEAWKPSPQNKIPNQKTSIAQRRWWPTYCTLSCFQSTALTAIGFGADAREKSGGNYSWKSHVALDNIFEYMAQTEFISFLGKALC